MTPERYKAEVLDELARRFEGNHNSLPDAYALIWAIDTYATFAFFDTNDTKAMDKNERIKKELEFKAKIEQHCEEFMIIRSASNAIKHIERDTKDAFVTEIGSISALDEPSYHAWFANGGNSEPSICITMNWELDPESGTYKFSGGKKLGSPPKNKWKSQYLKRLYRPAIDAIDAAIVNN